MKYLFAIKKRSCSNSDFFRNKKVIVIQNAGIIKTEIAQAFKNMF